MRALALLAIVLTSAGCSARDGIEIENAWARATPPGSTVGSAYAVIHATRDDTLESVSSPAAGRVEMHATTEEAGTMRMRPVEQVSIIANEPVKFAPGGLHLMLIDLREPLAAGATFSLTFKFRSTGPLTVDATVVAPGEEPATH